MKEHEWNQMQKSVESLGLRTDLVCKSCEFR